MSSEEAASEPDPAPHLGPLRQGAVCQTPALRVYAKEELAPDSFPSLVYPRRAPTLSVPARQSVKLMLSESVAEHNM